MSGYNGRRGPNVSRYLANLNTISPEQENHNEPPLETDFSMFMNTDFLNLDNQTLDNPTDIDLTSPLGFDLDVDNQHAGQANSSSAHNNNASANGVGEQKMDFNLNGDFQFADFSNFSNPIVDPSIQNLPQQSTTFPTYTSPVSSAVSPVAQGFDHSTGKKRKLEQSQSESNSQHAIDEAARVAAEEDKRRRNTAASARFRIKKKQREQALEKTAKEMTERVSVLETRIQQLETENTWLKGLITEKNGGKTSTSEIKARLHKHEENNVERSTGNRTDGVGTKAEGSKA